ncbi:MAG: hypothetical protein U9R41_06350 [Candidatus Marinimicrobia bacterium]|nr:hypothetical protein [Candidatus Neomarinimicrobiota bacterium]
MIKVNLLDPDGKDQKDSVENGEKNTVNKENIAKSTEPKKTDIQNKENIAKSTEPKKADIQSKEDIAKSTEPKKDEDQKKENIAKPTEPKKDEDQKRENIGDSSESKKTQDQENNTPFNNEHFFGFENGDNDEPNEEDNQVDNEPKFKKSYIGWLIVLLIIVISAILYFSLSDGPFKKMESRITKKPIKIEQMAIKDVDSVEAEEFKPIEEKVANVEVKIANVEEKIVSRKQKDQNIREKSKYKYLKNRINNSSRRLKATSKIFKYIPSGLNIKYLSVSKNEISFELMSNKDDIIDRFFGLLRKDKDFYDVKFKSIDNKYRFSKRGNFKVKFKKPVSTIEGKLKNLDVNNFIDYIALTADKTNLSFNKVLKKDIEIVSSPSMKKNRLQMEFSGNFYQIREFFNKINKIPGSFDVENIEIRNVYNGKYYKIILRIILFEKA